MVTIPPESIETVESGGGTLSVGTDGLISREVELRFLVRSMEGYTDAEAKAIELAPLYYDGHRRGSIQCRPVGGGWYQIAVSYGNTAANAYEDYGFETDDGVTFIPAGISVDTTGATELITQAWSDSEDPEAYVGKYPDEAQQTFGAVNVSGNQVNGVNVTVPAFNWTETWLVPAKYLLVGDDVNEPYAKTLNAMTGKVNKDEFRIFKPGEVLFLGARFDANAGQSMVSITYSFAAKERREQFMIGDIEVGIKDGHDFLWIQYETPEDATFEFKKPRYVYVDRIYERKDYTELKIGGTKAWSELVIHSPATTFAHPLEAAKRGLG